MFGRYRRMQGDTVFQPMGYDSFGIHSENYAIKVGESPQKMLARTTANYERQLRSLGHGYDWTRTVTTSDTDYYRWTQWLFVTLFKAGLAYRKEAQVNWCPSCKTVLADEQVIDGKCERCGSSIEKKNLAQWFFRITKYADRLLDNLNEIDWPEKIKSAQRQWIGRAEGLEISFKVYGQETSIGVWTRYWETVYGATFLVISPEYYLKSGFLNKESKNKDSIDAYVQSVMNKTPDERREANDKSGVDTGIWVINPANGEKIPVWIADYVLDGVGTGAVMGVPAHDSRDFDFAKKYKLPIIQVVSYSDESKNMDVANMNISSEDPGVLINSFEFNGLLSNGDGKEAIKSHLLHNSVAVESTNYHLRDWLISRQRYWGAPIPMIYCESCAQAGVGWLSQNDPSINKNHLDWESAGWSPVSEHDLPITLPEIDDYKPKGTSRGPLADHPEFYEVTCPNCGGAAIRETDVCDTFLDSSWYFLRYPSVDAKTSTSLPFDVDITKKWLPVNLYFGGAEHSVLHLMYARFVTQALFDLGHLTFEEPFPKFYAHGLMIKDGAKMSKSRGNVVNPDIYIEKYGADALRLYLMFMGPMDGSPDFRDTGIEGMQRFLDRLNEVIGWYGKRSIQEDKIQDLVAETNKTIQKVTNHIEKFQYNTAIAAVMEYVNFLRSLDTEDSEHATAELDDSIKNLTQLVAPFAPHLAEEIWSDFGETGSIHLSKWPTYDPSKITQTTVVLPVQVNGKLRGQVEIPFEDANNEEAIMVHIKSVPNLNKWLDGGVRKTIFVPGKILNFII